jgi:hypothetical protein
MPEISLLKQNLLTGLIEKYVAPPENVGRNMFKKKGHPFTEAKWDVIKGSRERSQPTLPNREAKIVAQLGIGQKTAAFIYVREKKAFEPTTIRWLREPGEMARANAEAAVRRETKDLNQRLERLEESYCWEALAGQITVNEVDVKATISMGFGATHKPTVSTAWSDAGADIIGDVYAWKKLIRKDTGYVATDLYLPGDTMEYVYKNTAIKGLFSEKHKWQYLQTSVIEGLLGLNWHVFDGGYEEPAGTFKPYINADYAIMMSKGGNPFQILEGLSADHDAPKNHTGKFSKSWEEKDPSARFFLIEYNFLPVVMRPDNVVYAKVLNP